MLPRFWSCLQPKEVLWLAVEWWQPRQPRSQHSACRHPWLPVNQSVVKFASNYLHFSICLSAFRSRVGARQRQQFRAASKYCECNSATSFMPTVLRIGPEFVQLVLSDFYYAGISWINSLFRFCSHWLGLDSSCSFYKNRPRWVYLYNPQTSFLPFLGL